MANNPFTDKLYLDSFRNKLEFAMTLFNKAAMKLYPARKGTESIRQEIIDFESPENRNRFINLDDCVFYCLEANGNTYWIGTTDIFHEDYDYRMGVMKDAVTRYDRMCSETSRCIIIPIPDTSTEENTIRTVSSFCQVFSWVHGFIAAQSAMTVYAAANYFYRVYGINLLIEDNFDKVFSVATGFIAYDQGELKKFIMEDKSYVKPLEGDLNYAKAIGAYSRYLDKRKDHKIIEDKKKINISGFTEEQIQYLRDMLDNNGEDDYDNDTYYEFIDHNLADIVNGKFDDYSEEELRAVVDSMTHFLPEIASCIMAYVSHDDIRDAVKFDVPEFLKTILFNVCKGLQEQALIAWDEDGLLILMYTIIYLYSYLPNHDAKYVTDFIIEHKSADERTIGEHKEVFKAFFDLAEKHYNNKDRDNPYMTEELSDFINEHIKGIRVSIKDIYEYILNCQVKSEEKDDSRDGEVSNQEA